MARSTVQLNDRDAAVEVVECGDPTGLPVFFMHGWPRAGGQCGVFLEAAREHGVRMIAPNRPGIGRSTPDPRHSMAGWASTVGALADALQIRRFRILGVSGGGPYALSTACLLPDRVDACAVVSGLPPLGPDGSGLPASLRLELRLKRHAPRVAAALLTAARLSVRRRATVGWLIRRLTGSPSDARALGTGAAAEASFRAFREAVESGPHAVLADSEPYTRPWGFAPEDIRVPVCFFHGLRDRTAAWHRLRPVAEQVPSAAIVLFDEDGHWAVSMTRQEAILGWLIRASA